MERPERSPGHLMIELCNYIYENYPNAKRMFPLWKLISMLDNNEDKIIYIKENGIFRGAAIFCKLDDGLMEELVMRKLDLTNPYHMRRALEADGKHIHFIKVLSDGYKTVMKGLRQVIQKENPETVTWFKDDLKKLHFVRIKRGELCQQRSLL